MAEKKVGVLVKEARTAAKLTQEKLAKEAGENLTAADISKCEQGKADLTTAQLKKIAIVCNVTQTSLVNAPKNLSASAAKKTAAKTANEKKATAAKKESTAKATAAKAASKTSSAKTASKTSSKTSSAKASSSAKTSSAKTAASSKTPSPKASSAKKKAEPAVPANANVSMKVTSTEQKLIQAYRGSTSDRKKAALKLLNGEYGDTVDKLLSVTNGTIGSSSSSSSSSSPDGIGDILGNVLGSLLGGK